MNYLALSTLVLVGVAGFSVCAPGTSGDALALAWLALWAAPAGALAGACGGPLRAALVPLAWVSVAGGAALLGLAPGPRAALAAGGLFALGLGLGQARPSARWQGAGALLLAGAALAALPSLGGVAGPAPWPAPVAAFLLDCSPVTLVVECAGIDWMRHPSVYGPVGADAMDPSLRMPWSGDLAVLGSVVMGCACAALGIRLGASPRGRMDT